MEMRNIIRIVEGLQYEMFPPNSLYHTTSPAAAFEILKSKTLRPNTSDGFVSLSEKPHLYDISANGAVLIYDFRQLYSQIEPVKYTEEWANEHPEQARYIAGEGWIEQWEAPLPDENGWEDEDTQENAYHYAELEAFLAKSAEHEWISLHPGKSVQFVPSCVTGLILEKIDDEVHEELAKMGYGHVKLLAR